MLSFCRRMVLCAVVLILAAVATAQDMSYVPLDPLWDLENRLAVRGEVSSIQEQLFPVDRKTGKPAEKPFDTRKYVFRDGKLVGETGIGYDNNPTPEAEVKYKDGRRHQIIRTDHQQKVTKQTATYDPQGRLQSVVIDEAGEERTIDIAIAPTADGGYTITWEGLTLTAGNERQQIQRTMHVRLMFDKAGKLVGRTMVRNEQEMPPTTFGRNDKGEVDTVTMTGRQPTSNTYQRDYDEKGNWIKQTRHRITKAGEEEKKELQDVRTRQITYGK